MKVGTKIDAELLRRAKRCAARRGKKLREVFEESLQVYLGREAAEGGAGSIRDSWGALRLSRRDLKDLLDAPLWYEAD